MKERTLPSPGDDRSASVRQIEVAAGIGNARVADDYVVYRLTLQIPTLYLDLSLGGGGP